MKFHYGEWVTVLKGFYKGSRGHIVSHRDATLGLGESIGLYRVLLDYPSTANVEHYARCAPSVTIEVQDSEIESAGIPLPGSLSGAGRI